MSAVRVTPNSRDHAIVIGIDHYERFDRLHGAVNDADCFHRWLVDPTGGNVPPQNIAVFRSTEQPIAPVLKQIEDQIFNHLNWFKHSHARQRRLYLFASGHGRLSLDSDDVEECRVLMADAHLPRLVTQNLGMASAGRVYRATAMFEQIVLLADACRELASFTTAALGLEEIVKELRHGAVGKDVEVLTAFATVGGKPARERELPACHGGTDLNRRGRFTYALVDGLKRAVDENGRITWLSLGEYTKELVRRISGGDQAPEFHGTGTVVLVEQPPPPTTVRVLVSLSDPNATLRVLDGVGLEPMAVPPVRLEDSSWFQLDLPSGRYVFESSHNGVERQQVVTAMGLVVHVDL